MLDKKMTGIVAYLTWIGLLIAIILGDREGAKFHLNQALVIWLVGFLSFIPFVGWIISVFCFICAIIGLIGALKEEEKSVPILGKYQLLK